MQQQTVVITGASAGIGRATARRFAAAGARIGLIARGHDRLEQTAAEVRDRGGDAAICPLDVTDADALEAAAQDVESRFGPIDVWINGAMATIFAPVADITPLEFARATAVTYLGTVNGTLTALRRMKSRDRGVIVQVGSALAYRSIPLQAPYCAAKHAMLGFTDSLRSELLHDRSRIRLAVVHLPGMNTPQFQWARNRMGHRPQPVPPIFEPEFAAEAIFQAARHPRREVWVGWPTVKTILGQRVMPGILDRILARKGYDGQLTDAAMASSEGNLFVPVAGDFAARGPFAGRAREHPVPVRRTLQQALTTIAALPQRLGWRRASARNGQARQ